MVKIENQPLCQAVPLLEEDRLTFTVLANILPMKCQKSISDMKSFILCYSCRPYPVWIWTANGAGDEAYAQVSKLIDTEFKEEHFTFNLKPELYEYLRQHDQQNLWKITTRMLSYDCPHPVAPIKKTDGKIVAVTDEEIDTTMPLLRGALEAIEHYTPAEEDLKAEIRRHMKSGELYLWQTETGEAVAICYAEARVPSGFISLVYTLPDRRRKGYAAHLVYEVSQLLSDRGVTPMLYTDGDYPASNACYKSIGYVQRGGLYTVRRKMN